MRDPVALSAIPAAVLAAVGAQIRAGERAAAGAQRGPAALSAIHAAIPEAVHAGERVQEALSALLAVALLGPSAPAQRLAAEHVAEGVQCAPEARERADRATAAAAQRAAAVARLAAAAVAAQIVQAALL